jgi:hypothetical protein
MPLIINKYKNGFYYGNDINYLSKKLENEISISLNRKNEQNKADETYIENGGKLIVKKFKKEIKKKIKDHTK